MKSNYFKCCLIAVSFFGLSCAQTGFSDERSVKSYDKQWERALQGHQERSARLVLALGSSDRNNALESLQGLSTNASFESKKERAEDWIFTHVLPGWSERFDRTVTFYGLTIRQDHDLIDLERSPWSRIVYQEPVRVGSTEMAFPPVLLVDPPTPMRNSARMSGGESPYGPDNSPVRVCALLSGASPIFYEMREGEVAFVMETMHHPQPSFSCLDPEVASAYWRQRRGDFVGKLGVEKTPPKGP